MKRGTGVFLAVNLDVQILGGRTCFCVPGTKHRPVWQRIQHWVNQNKKLDGSKTKHKECFQISFRETNVTIP